MADLDSLIRYRKHAVDEKRRALARFYDQMQELQEQKQAVYEEIEKEKELAREMATAEASAFLGRYMDGARRKIHKFETEIAKTESRIRIAQEDMRTAFAELKKIEITQRNREERERAEERRKEDQQLDEIAIEAYRRRQEEQE